MFRGGKSSVCRAAHAVRAMQGRCGGEARGCRQRTPARRPAPQLNGGRTNRASLPRGPACYCTDRATGPGAACAVPAGQPPASALYSTTVDAALRIRPSAAASCACSSVRCASSTS